MYPAKDNCRNMAGTIKILVVAGASGGHIYPAISLLEALDERGVETLLVLPKRSIKNRLVPSAFRIKYICITPIVPGFDLKCFLAVLRFLKGAFESFFLVLEFNPDIVVGFGCIESIPIIFFAWLFRIKTLIHEQNVFPGRANRLLAFFSDRIAVSFAETKGFLKDFSDKIVLTGNLLRHQLQKIEKKEALDFFGFREDKFTILVMGGSQGSHRINMGFLRAASRMQNKEQLQIIHLTGIKDYASLNKSYKDLSVDSKIIDFFMAVHYAYSACDLIISRAGATTVSEIVFFRVPAILIPYPYANKHQSTNAEVLQKKGCAFVIDDEELDRDRLQETIGLLLRHPEKLKEMHSGYAGFITNNACGLLADEVLNLINR